MINMCSKYKYILYFLMCCMIVCSAVSGAEVVIQNKTLIAKGIADEGGVGAFDIALVTDSGLSLEVSEWMEPYMGAVKKENDLIKICGFTGDVKAPNGDVPLMTFSSEGSGSVTVYVVGLYNTNGDSIKVDNPEYSDSSAETPVTTTPVYIDKDSGSSKSYVSYSPHFENITESETSIQEEDTADVTDKDKKEENSINNSQIPISVEKDDVKVIPSAEKSVKNSENKQKSPLSFVLIIVSLSISLIIAKTILMRKQLI